MLSYFILGLFAGAVAKFYQYHRQRECLLREYQAVIIKAESRVRQYRKWRDRLIDEEARGE